MSEFYEVIHRDMLNDHVEFCRDLMSSVHLSSCYYIIITYSLLNQNVDDFELIEVS